MAVSVYKFRVELEELENYFWREIEVTSGRSVAHLAYTILASYRGLAMHLFCIETEDKHYEIDFEGDLEDYIRDKEIVDPVLTKLEKMKLNIGDKFKMKYDYGAGWCFNIELVETSPLARGKGSSYPKVLAGAGRGIIEDAYPYELLDYIKQIDNGGELPMVLNGANRWEEWDYREFVIKFYSDSLLRGDIQRIQDAYEVPRYYTYEDE